MTTIFQRVASLLGLAGHTPPRGTPPDGTAAAAEARAALVAASAAPASNGVTAN